MKLTPYFASIQQGRFTSHWLFTPALLAILTLLLYGHTLDVPFYLDDFSSIQENPFIFQWQGTLAELWQFSAARIIGYLTIAWNFQFHHFSVEGYHVVNIVIHFLCSYMVFFLIQGLIQTPAVNEQLSPQAQRWLPLLVALVFLVHPLQTQAVTYVIQRLASLAALFYITSLASFVQARLATQPLHRTLWFIACFLFAVLAFFTKQNTVTLPLTIILIEIIFFPKTQQQLLKIAGIGGVLLMGAAILLTFSIGKNPFSLEAMQALTRETTEISRVSYLATQMTVLWWYVRLFFLPNSLHIDYDYPIATGFLDVWVLFALIAHLAVFAGAFLARKRYPLLCFGIVFYYVAHAVESSIIPISDVVFEHRTYLPNLGLIILCSWFALSYLPLEMGEKATFVIILMLLLLLSGATWWRNQLWRDPIALWKNNVQHAPHKERAWVILGKHLLQANRPNEGLKALEQSAIERPQANGQISKSYTVEALINMVVALRMLKEYKRALELVEQVTQGTSLRPFDHAKFEVNKGNILYELKHYAEAEQSYRHALQLYPANLSGQLNLATLLVVTERYAEAATLYEGILKIEPNNPIARDNLQKIRQMQSN